KTGRARWAFQATFGALVFSVMMFNYHVTGSWWPAALWEANGIGVTFNSMGFALNFIGYAFDRRWGLLPHSLLLLGALPGLLVLSLDAGRAYNWHHDKTIGGALRDVSLSGWKPNLAFPDIRGEAWGLSHANFVLFLCVVAFVLGLSWLAFVRARKWNPALKW